MGRRVNRVVRKFRDNFGWINADDILPICSSDNKTVSKYADVRKIPDNYRAAIPGYKVMMTVYYESYYQLPTHVQDLIVIHELQHLEPHPKIAGDYKLRRHDIEDWSDMVTILGVGWPRLLADKDFDVMKEAGRDWVKVIKRKVRGNAETRRGTRSKVRRSPKASTRSKGERIARKGRHR